MWENVGGSRSATPIFSLEGIPLTPGPLMVVIKVAASQVANATGYWPPALADSVETIAASYVQGETNSKVRLFNLSPDTKSAGMGVSSNGTKDVVSDVAYGLGSDWVVVATESASYTFKDDLSLKTLTSRTETPPAAPLGFTNMLLGLQGGAGVYAVQAVPLMDAPEGGTCHPSKN